MSSLDSPTNLRHLSLSLPSPLTHIDHRLSYLSSAIEKRHFLGFIVFITIAPCLQNPFSRRPRHIEGPLYLLYATIWLGFLYGIIFDSPDILPWLPTLAQKFFGYLLPLFHYPPFSSTIHSASCSSSPPSSPQSLSCPFASTSSSPPPPTSSPAPLPSTTPSTSAPPPPSSLTSPPSPLPPHSFSSASFSPPSPTSPPPPRRFHPRPRSCFPYNNHPLRPRSQRRRLRPHRACAGRALLRAEPPVPRVASRDAAGAVVGRNHMGDGGGRRAEVAGGGVGGCGRDARHVAACVWDMSAGAGMGVRVEVVGGESGGGSAGKAWWLSEGCRWSGGRGGFG